MKTKYYIIALHTEDFPKKERVKIILSKYGSVIEPTVHEEASPFVWFVAANEQQDAITIRDAVREELDVFKDILVVAQTKPLDMASINIPLTSLVEENRNNEREEGLNFHRFRSRKEALATYSRERPTWWNKMYPGQTLPIEFDQWLWLPIRKTGIYDSCEDKKLIEG